MLCLAQFPGSKMEVHVHVKMLLQAEFETERSRLVTIVGSSPTLPGTLGAINFEYTDSTLSKKNPIYPYKHAS